MLEDTVEAGVLEAAVVVSVGSGEGVEVLFPKPVVVSGASVVPVIGGGEAEGEVVSPVVVTVSSLVVVAMFEVVVEPMKVVTVSSLAVVVISAVVVVVATVLVVVTEGSVLVLAVVVEKG